MNNVYRIAVLSLLLPNLSYAQDIGLDALDIESLMGSDVQLSSAMKRLQSAKETAASVYVLSGQEITDAGVSSIPQALKLVPGMQVRQLDNNIWAISMRSSAGAYSSKLLVLVDGLSVYDPIHSGVNWQSLNLSLFDIDRIEVVRGQGSLLWGSNATNGVINIITKHSEDTRGTKISASTGTETDHDLTLRYGSDLGELGSFRISAQSRNTSESEEGLYDFEPNDYSQSESVMGRLDLNLRDDLFLLAQAQYQEQDIGNAIRVPNSLTNLNEPVADEDNRRNYSLMSRIENSVNRDTSQMLQVAYAGATSKNIYYEEQNDTLDIDYQRNTRLNTVQLDWGVNYRYADLSLGETDYISTQDGHYDMEQYGAFVQAQFEVSPDELKLIIGNKSEHNEMTGWEHQPTAKLVWTPDSRHSFWASVSRGVRIPSLLEYTATAKIGGIELSKINSDLASYITDSIYIAQYIQGNEDVKAETSISNEIGYRYNSVDWSADLSFFHTNADNVTALESSTSLDENDATTALVNGGLYNYLSSAVVTQTFITDVELETYGGELVLTKQLSDSVKTELGYSFISMDYGLPDSTVYTLGSDSIIKQWMLKVSASVTKNQTIFGQFRYEDGEAYDTDDFYALDLSWNWKVSNMVTVGITANNLLNGSYLEYASTDQTLTIPSYVEPTVNAQVLLHF